MNRLKMKKVFYGIKDNYKEETKKLIIKKKLIVS